MNILQKLTNLFDRNYGLEEDFQDYCHKHKCKKEYWGNTGRGAKFFCVACGKELSLLFRKRKKRKEQNGHTD